MDVGLALLRSLESCLLAQADGLSFYVLKAGGCFQDPEVNGSCNHEELKADLLTAPLFQGTACCSLSGKT